MQKIAAIMPHTVKIDDVRNFASAKSHGNRGKSPINSCFFAFAILSAFTVTAEASNIAPSDILYDKLTLYTDTFTDGIQNWVPEIERPGSITAKDGVLDIDAPAGATLWFRHELSGSIIIEYEAAAISAGGANDWVSDLNCFWMATDPQRKENFFKPARSGKFEDYNTLYMYYVGLGGNRNTTTRFRRYIGDKTVRPLLPQNDLSAPAALLQPNHWQTIRIVADGKNIQYYRDGTRLFDYQDRSPYLHGYFGLRTTKNHMQIRNFRIFRRNTP